MWLIYIIDIVALVTLLTIALRRRVEDALPLAAFVFVLIPRDAAIQIPGLFDLTTQRTVLMALAVMYLVLPRSKGPSTSLDATFKWLIVAHIAWCAVSTANSIVPTLSLKKMVSEVLEYYLLFYIFLKSISRTETIKRILFAIVGAIILSSCFGAVEAYSNWSVMEWFPSVPHSFDGWSAVGEASGRDARVASTFANSILFGAGLTIGIVMTLCLLKTANTPGKKAFLWSGLLLMFLNIYKTSSRGPWLGLAISLGILLVCEHGRVRKYLAAIAVLTVAVLVIRPGVWDTIANIYVATFDPESPLGSSFEYRYVLRDLAVKAVSKNTARSLWGYGMESFYYLKLEGQLYGKPYKFLSCDSAWLELLVETGYVGLLIVASLLFLPLWRAWKGMRRGAYPIQVYFVSAMIGYYFMMMSAALYGWGQTGYILWMMIAMSFAYRSLRRAVEQAPLVKLAEINPESTLRMRSPLLDYGS
jgi:hypothetical protein